MSDIFHMFKKEVLLKSRCSMKDMGKTFERVQMFDQSDSSNRWKVNGCSFEQLLQHNLSWFLP